MGHTERAPIIGPQPGQKRKALSPPEPSLERPPDSTATTSNSPEHNTTSFMALEGRAPHETRTGLDHRARSNEDSEESWPYMSFTRSRSRTSSPPPKRKRIERPLRASPSSQQSPQHSATKFCMPADLVDTTSVHDIGSSIAAYCTSSNLSPPTSESANNTNPLNGIPTITTISAHDSNTELDHHEHSIFCEAKRKLRSHLAHFLTSNEPKYQDVLKNVIPSAKTLYALSPQRLPHNDLYLEFRDLSRALDHWQTVISGFKVRTGAMGSAFDDSLHQLPQQSLKDRLAAYRQIDSKAQSYLGLDRWTNALALFFEGLLGDDYMPFPFEHLVARLRAANQPLCDSFAVTSDASLREAATCYTE
jgi:hypothetical protein